MQQAITAVGAKTGDLGGEAGELCRVEKGSLPALAGRFGSLSGIVPTGRIAPRPLHCLVCELTAVRIRNDIFD